MNSKTFSKKVDDIFLNPVRVKNGLQLNSSILLNSSINNVSHQQMYYTFVEYIQGVKLLNDKIFTFSNKTSFTLKSFSAFDVGCVHRDINLGLHLNDNNIALIFNNEILYNKENKFDFNLLRPELLKSGIICDAVKIFSAKDIALIDVFDSYYSNVHRNKLKGLRFTFYPTDYQIDNNLNITSINFTFNDENTLD
jgi:hypothetical protein